MRIIELYIDFGTGFEITNPAISGTIGQKNDINQFIYRKFTELECVFFGNDYDKLKNAIDNGTIKLPYKVKLYNVSTQLYEDFCTGDVFIRQNLDFERKTITLSKFVAIDDYSEILQFSEIEIDVTLMWSTGKQILALIELEKLYNIAIEYNGTFNQYTIDYNPDGTSNVGVPFYSWAFFTLESTETLPNGNFLYHAYTYESPFNVNSAALNIIPWLGGVKWVRLTDTSITLDLLRDDSAVSIVSMIEFLLSELNISLTVENNSMLAPYSFADISKLSVNTDLEPSGAITLKLSDIFNILENLFQIHWYIESGEIKFKHISEIDYSTQLFDIRTLFKLNLNKGANKIQYYDKEKPIIEIFSTISGQTYGFAPLNIKYTQSTGNSTQTISASVVCDLQNAWNNITNVKQGLLLLADDEIFPYSITKTNVTPNGTYIYNNKASWNFIFSEFLDNYRPFNSGYVNFTENTESLNNIIPDVLYTQNFELFYNEFIFNAINNHHVKTEQGNGKITSMQCDVLTSKMTINLQYFFNTYYLVDDELNYITDENYNRILVF